MARQKNIRGIEPIQGSDRDRLVSRPNVPLPTCEDPRGPHALGYPADPKPDPQGEDGQGDDPHAGDIGYTV
jgi:hypothetical protein